MTLYSSIIVSKIPWAEKPMGYKGLDMNEHTQKLVINLYALNICLPFNCFILQFSCSVVSNSWWPHGLQYPRLPCPSSTLGACSNSCPSSRWCHPTISSSVISFPSCFQSSQHQGFFSNESAFRTKCPNIGASASTSVLYFINIATWMLFFCS